MAANLKNQGIAMIGKRIGNMQIRSNATGDGTSMISALTSRRTNHASTYEKNHDDQARPSIVRDEGIEPQSDKYWGPHPKTGVFGPESDHKSSSASGESGQDSVLEEKAFFRPTSLEDLEKPHHQ